MVDWLGRHSGTGLSVGEVVATAGLIAVVSALARSGRAALSAIAVAGYIGSTYFFASWTARHDRAGPGS